MAEAAAAAATDTATAALDASVTTDAEAEADPCARATQHKICSYLSLLDLLPQFLVQKHAEPGIGGGAVEAALDRWRMNHLQEVAAAGAAGVQEGQDELRKLQAVRRQHCTQQS